MGGSERGDTDGAAATVEGSADGWVRGAASSPLVGLGVGILLGTLMTAVGVGVPPSVAAAQSSLPLAVGGALVLYGRYGAGDAVDRFRGTVLRWTGYGVVAFFVVGLWFGQVSRLFDTSLALAVVASLCLGAAFGATVGVYAARLRATNAALASRGDELERFADVVSHDLRNPLNVVRGRVELAAAETDDATADHLAAAERALDRMESLIDDLLTLARQGEAAGEPEPVDLAACCEASWEAVAAPEATLVVDASATVEADPDRLRQLLENLFRNSVEHGSTGAADDVTITVEDGADWFAVADDGPGFPASVRERAFEEGVSTAEEGTGLGLSIVRRVADAHGWTVTAGESDAGGARVEVSGVAVREEEATAPAGGRRGTTDT